ncbi:MAG: PLP-dependent aminotransferase family protein [Lachnospiraceae bacterium]
MLTINLDHTSDKSLYIQLYEEIKNQIISHTLPPKSILPSKRNLSAHLGVSVKTIENAYAQLLLEGYIYSEEKRGYFVSTLEDYRTGSKTNSQKYTTRFHDDEYLVDLKANKNNMENFPTATWFRLMRETLSYEEERLFDTVPFNGIAELRIAIARHLKDFRGMDVSPDQIIIGAGTEYLYARLIQLLGKDTCYAVENPGYQKIPAIYRSNDVPYKAIELDSDGIRMDLLERSNCNVVHIAPAHHFPLGFVTPINRRLELLQWVNAGPNRYIIEDDYDSEYRYHGRPVPPLYSIDIRGKIIYMNTFSKSIAPALRISYMVLPENLMERYISTMNFYSCTVSSFEQFTLAKFIEGNYLERTIHRMKRHNAGQRNLIVSAIEKSDLNQYTKILEDSAGTHFLLKVQTSLSDEELSTELKDKGILVSCLSEYCENPNPQYDSTLVINYSGITEKQIEYFIETLLKILVDTL